MKPAAERMADELAKIEISMPDITVVQNVTAAAPASVDELKENLLAQLYSPVLWTKSVQGMVEQGIESTVECGPGKVLSGLNKKVHKPLSVAAISDAAGLEKALAQ
jgi:[acyl-carrier-protein] S-malonyltransferase